MYELHTKTQKGDLLRELNDAKEREKRLRMDVDTNSILLDVIANDGHAEEIIQRLRSGDPRRAVADWLMSIEDIRHSRGLSSSTEPISPVSDSTPDLGRAKSDVEKKLKEARWNESEWRRKAEQLEEEANKLSRRVYEKEHRVNNKTSGSAMEIEELLITADGHSSNLNEDPPRWSPNIPPHHHRISIQALLRTTPTPEPRRNQS